MKTVENKLKRLYNEVIPASKPSGASEVLIARKLKELMQLVGLYPIVYDLGNIHVYDDSQGIWVELERDLIRSLVIRFQSCKTSINRTISISASTTKGVTECFRLDKDILNYGFFSQPAEGIPFQNCLVTLENGGFKVIPHAPGNRLRAVFPFDYVPEEKPAAFLAMLREVFPDADSEEKIAALQEMTGAAMGGVATHYQRCLLATGGGSNGKNTVFDILSGVFPPSFVTSISPQQWGEQFYRARLHSSALNLVPDMQDTKILSNTDFKPIISGDPVMASHKHRDPFEFRCRAAHWFICNELPTVVDFSYGYRRRFLILEFNRQFVAGQPGVRVKEDIVNEILAKERSAIGYWALLGYKRLVENGTYTEPPSHDAAMNKWLSHSDPVADFVGTECSRVDSKPDMWSTVDDLFNIYKTWAKRADHKTIGSKRDFKKRLDQLGIPKHGIKCPLSTAQSEEIQEIPGWLS